MRKSVKTAAAVPATAETEPEVKETVKAAEPAKKATRTRAKAAKPAAEKAVKAEKPAEEKEGKAVKTTKPAASKPAKETVYLQFYGKEINQADLIKEVKKIWTGELKRKVGEIKTITLYVKPEENAAYYVINDDVTGSISLS